jgi:hypothetical protein
MEVSGQHHAPAALPAVKQSRYAINKRLDRRICGRERTGFEEGSFDYTSASL